jgi:osmotically-inducible protein OsmY
MKNNVELRADVLDELAWDPSVDASRVGATAMGGVVTLTGHAPSFVQKLAAERAAKRVAGVRAVANDIDVTLTGADVRADPDIAHAAADALEWSASVPAGRVKATVRDGRVTLEGNVDWGYQRRAAEDAVRFLWGVRGVTNLITIGPGPKPADILDRIKNAFRRSAELDAQRISTETHDGRVVLRGDVRSWAEREEAERIAWAAPGVTEVENRIMVS